MWVESVVGSRPCFDGFSPGSPVSLPPQNQHPNPSSSRAEDLLIIYSFLLFINGIETK